MSSKRDSLWNLRRRITTIMLSMILVCTLTGCNDVSQNVEEAIASTEDAVLDETLDHGIFYESLFLRYQIFVPSNFGKVYNNGTLYEEGINLWTELQYEKAEKCLLAIEDEIKTSGPVYPDDMAFVKETIGCLYIDMAKYDKAYDYLIDALVTLQDLYGEKDFYTNTVSMALCHYYFALGDYEWCLREIQTLRENNTTDSIPKGDRWEYLKLFINVVLNDLEADIYLNQFKMQEAYDLYIKNWRLCEESIQIEEDDTFSSAIEVDVLIALGDFYTNFLTEEEYCELADKVYDKALSFCDYYVGDSVKAKEAEILMKKGYFLCNFADTADTAKESMEQAMEIQAHLYGTEGTYAGLVESYRLYAEYLGFALGDEDGADEYYQKALSLCEQTYKHNHPETAVVYESMGRYYGNRRREFEMANERFRDGIEIYNNLLIENNPLVAQMYLELAGGCRSLGDENGCQECLEKNKEIETKLGYSHMSLGDS